MQKKIKPDRTRPRAANGRKYYIIDQPGDKKGSINIVDVIETGYPMDLRFWESGNYFLSKEEAETERDRIESIGELKRCSIYGCKYLITSDTESTPPNTRRKACLNE